MFLVTESEADIMGGVRRIRRGIVDKDRMFSGPILNPSKLRQEQREMASMRRIWHALIMLFCFVCLAFAVWVLLELVDAL
jgi:hypothetical protein